MGNPIAQSLTDAELDTLQKQWEADGFKFVGNGFEHDEEDPLCCPSCGDFGDVFWALWEHPTRIRNEDADTEYKPHLLNAINTCYTCGYQWIDVD